MSKCFFTDCKKDGAFQCSRCKLVKYCCPDHQKLDWKTHKSQCNDNTGKKSKKGEEQPVDSTDKKQYIDHKEPNTKTSIEQAVDSTDKRHCRCMFCGEALVLGSEVEAIEHMKVCVALQEQLASKDQFTVPTMVKEKYTKS